MSMPINGNYDAWLLQQQQLNGVNGAQATGVQGTDAEAASAFRHQLYLRFVHITGHPYRGKTGSRKADAGGMP